MFATYAIFGLNGLVFASWAARIPAASNTLGLGSGQTGTLLLIGAIGSVLSLPLAGLAAARFGTGNTVRLGGTAAGLAAVAVALGLVTVSVPVVAVGLFLFGLATGPLPGHALEESVAAAVRLVVHGLTP